MRSIFLLPVVLSFGLVCVSQSPRALPSSMRHAQELEVQNERDFPEEKASVAELRAEADQLAHLAASIPTDVQNAGKGLLAKDLLQRLKRIEKLSKHLRSELGR